MGRAFAALLLALAACGPAPEPGGAPGPMLRFPPDAPLPALRSNAGMARDFLDLSFRMESGQVLPVLTRFDHPIRLTTEGPLPPTARAETEALMGRLSREAGLDIGWGSPGNLVLSFLPAAELRRIEPRAACFVIPNVRGRAEYRALRGTEATDWARLHRRMAATIFLPSDAAPQELRDCLHEELAQALGPVNDLWQLPDSVFNDDNFQSVLTGFDMLMLRVTYAPELENGMGAAEVASRLPGILARLNPGGGGPDTSAGPTPKTWEEAVAAAMAAGRPRGARIAAGARALQIATGAGWQDARAGFSWFLQGRLLAASDPVAARAAFAEAASLYRPLPDGGVHLAHALMQLAVLDLALDNGPGAEAAVTEGLPLAQRARNAALIASFQLIAAELRARAGDAEGAAALRLDSLPAARYGFGSGGKIRAREAEIAALARRPG